MSNERDNECRGRETSSLKNANKCFFGDNPVLTAKLSKISRSKAEMKVKRERERERE